MARFFVTVKQNDSGRSLDSLLAAHMTFFTPADIRLAIMDGGVYINKRRVTDPLTIVNTADEITVYYYESTAACPTVAIGDRILFEDDWMLAIDKPSGVASEMTRQGKRHTLSEFVDTHLRSRYFRAIHRLDMGTSGVILFGKKPLATRTLMIQFQKHLIRKQYLARVLGAPSPPEGTIETLLDRDPADPRKMKSSPTGKTAITRYHTIIESSSPRSALLEIDLLTGRMHQIRVHFSELGHPVLGDWLYGRADSAPRLMLHARSIRFTHPKTGQAMAIEAPIPELFKRSMPVAPDELSAPCERSLDETR